MSEERVFAEYMVVDEVADALGFHPVTVQKKLWRGDLPSVKWHNMYLVRRSDVEKFRQAQEILQELRERAMHERAAQERAAREGAVPQTHP